MWPVVTIGCDEVAASLPLMSAHRDSPGIKDAPLIQLSQYPSMEHEQACFHIAIACARESSPSRTLSPRPLGASRSGLGIFRQY